MAKAPPRQPEEPGGAGESQVFDRPVALTCPDCGGALHRIAIGSMVKFRCHIGHSYTAEIMAAAQFDEMEKIMRAAVRCLNERAEFCRERAEDTRSGEPALSAEWHAASRQAMDRAYKLRDLIEQDWLAPQAA